MGLENYADNSVELREQGMQHTKTTKHMSENTPTTTAPAANNLPPLKTLELGDKTYSLVLDAESQEYVIKGETFDTVERMFQGAAFAGVKYFALQSKTVAAALEKWGEEAVLGMINDRLLFQFALKAKSKIGKFDDNAEGKAARANYMANLLASSPYVITPEDAESFVPGARELSVKALFLRADEARKEGNFALSIELAKKAMAILEREQELTQ